MELGIFAKTFSRPTIEETLDAVAGHGLRQIQFNFSSVGLPTLPRQIDDAVLDRLAEALRARNLSVAAVSGTFNLIHPDRKAREEGFRGLETIASACSRLGAGLVTLCTGTRHAADLWSSHPDNDSPAARHDLEHSLRRALAIAEPHRLLLGLEPEVHNVLASASQARRLLDAFGSSRLKIVIDPANLFKAGSLGSMEEKLEEAFALLGPDIALAHAKDLRERHGQLEYVAPGKGDLDFPLYLRWLKKINFRGPLILHGLAESEVAESLRFLRALETEP